MIFRLVDMEKLAEQVEKQQYDAALLDILTAFLSLFKRNQTPLKTTNNGFDLDEIAEELRNEYIAEQKSTSPLQPADLSNKVSQK